MSETFNVSDSVNLVSFAKNSYLDYAMYTLNDRALPNVADGLKPVHRRIIYAMRELGLVSSAKYKKSARTVGDVLGKYHPHGDSACYEAMVLMAQPFSTLHPLVDGQGNFGSIDEPKSFAAMRYTESKLTKFAETLLSEIKLGTVDFAPNFDGTLTEPVTLPAQLPNILINGTEGIAVGMRSMILSHNAEEVVAACVAFLQNSKISEDDLLSHVQGPDLPLGGVITNSRESIVKMYKEGKGKVTIRASYHVEGDEIIIDSIPYQASAPKILEQIAHLVEEKKFSLIQSIDDESDANNPVRIVLTMRSNRVNPEEVMSHLFVKTDLQKSHTQSFIAINTEGKPQPMSFMEVVRQWTQCRQNVFERKKRHRLAQVDARLHIVEGLIIAYNILDEVIEIIRTAEDPRAELMLRFALSEIQADAILDMKLRHLAKLEEYKLTSEQDELDKEKIALETLLASDRKIKNAVIKELLEVTERVKEPRRTLCEERKEAKEISEDTLVPAVPVTVIISAKGWVRSAKGHDFDISKLNYRTGDKYSQHIEMKSNESLLILTEMGRAHIVPVADFPNAKGTGEPLTSKISLKQGDLIKQILIYDPEKAWLMHSDSGYGFVCNASDLFTKNKTGKDVITLKDGESSLPPVDITASDEVLVVTSLGRALIIQKSEINTLSKGRGVKLINLNAGEVAKLGDGLNSIISLADDTVVKVRAGRKVHRIDKSNFEIYRGKRPSRGRFIDSEKKGDIKLEIENNT